MPKLEDIPPFPATIPKPKPVGKSETYQIKLITPMFGGGVETRANDQDFPIRPTSIRGQLQFWWRATVGAQYDNLKDLRAAQTEIWGSTDNASRVQALVEPLSVDPPQPCARFEKDDRNPGTWRTMPAWQQPFQGTSLSYALFPFQGQLGDRRASIQVPPASCIHNATFNLTLRCPSELWPQVEPAVWAWVNFGGLGSRTRRGCGAIYCEQFAPADAADLGRMWKQHMPELYSPRTWPTLAVAALLKNNPSKPVQAWSQIIERFKHFRQGVELGRNPGQQANRPGRSRFPEPETIRRVTRRRSREHQRMPDIPDDAFPRAEFGLPIVFHFKDDRQGDPQDTVLYPATDSQGNKRERMASPLILKPLALKGGKQAVPLVLRLKTPVLEQVDLRAGDHALALPVTTVIRGSRLSSYRSDSPLRGSSSGSALEAFMAYVSSREQGYAEVTR